METKKTAISCLLGLFSPIRFELKGEWARHLDKTFKRLLNVRLITGVGDVKKHLHKKLAFGVKMSEKP